LYPLGASSQKRGERPEGLSGSTMFFEETFGTVFHHPENIEKIPLGFVNESNAQSWKIPSDRIRCQTRSVRNFIAGMFK
jgi:hypothetical protein